MKYIKQFAAIILVSFLGELCHHFIPLPIPASIYGLLLMLVGLCAKIIPYESVKETGHFMIEIMPLMFIPAGVGLMEAFDVLAPLLVPYILITVVSTVLVMAVSGRVTQRIIKGKKVDHD